jgi:hypothetical protein
MLALATKPGRERKGRLPGSGLLERHGGQQPSHPVCVIEGGAAWCRGICKSLHGKKEAGVNQPFHETATRSILFA